MIFFYFFFNRDKEMRPPRKRRKTEETAVAVDFSAVLPVEILWLIMHALPMGSLWSLRNVSPKLRTVVDDYVNYYVKGLNYNDRSWIHDQAMHCVVHKHIDGLRFWLDFGAHVQRNANELLQTAVEDDNLVAGEMLLTCGAVPDDDIMSIAVKGATLRTDMLELLLKHSASAARYCGAIQAAVSRKKIKAVEMLLMHGAIVENELLHIAVCDNSFSMTKLLLKHLSGIREDEIMYAVMYGSHKLIRAMLNHSSVNVHWNWASALYHAATRGRHRVVKLLLDHGAYVDVQDSVAFRRAASRGHVDTIRVFIQHNVQVNACNGEALLCAVQEGHFEAVKLLLENGGNVLSFMQKAFQYACPDIAQLLIDFGAVRRSPRLASK